MNKPAGSGHSQSPAAIPDRAVDGPAVRSQTITASSGQQAAWQQPMPRRAPLILLLLFLGFWLAMAIEPVNRQDWLLENLLTIALITVLIVTFGRARLSDAAYGCIFVFLLLHTIGSHYTYSLVPYDEWMRRLTGRTLNSLFGFERNHYDRLVHFLYGVLMLLPSAEVLNRIGSPRGAGRWLLPIVFLMSQSATYELIEWAAASIVAPDLGSAYLGTQGDEWDGQKDMALATGGAVLGVLLWRRRLLSEGYTDAPSSVRTSTASA
jgi:putative membrane protein